MHTKNGLWEACRNGELPNFLELEELIWRAVPETPKGEHLPVLAGSSVHFDLAFMKSAMPRAAARFSHRVLDVSAIKLDCCSQGMPPLPKADAHCAYLANAIESIAHLKACREWQAERISEAYEDGAQDAEEYSQS